jgi:hypothetical protein
MNAVPWKLTLFVVVHLRNICGHRQGVNLQHRNSKRRKVLPFSQVKTNQVLVEVGGPIDEISVTLAIYRDELVPREISRILGVEPTSCHLRGERRGPFRSPPYQSGAWFLKERGREVESAEVIVDRLFKRLPEDPAIWGDLKLQHDIQLRFGLHMTGWNKGLSISLELLTRIVEIGASVELDIYAYGEDV